MNPTLPRTDLLPDGIPTVIILLMALVAAALWVTVRLITHRGHSRLPRHVIVALRIVTACMATWTVFQFLGRFVVFGCPWPVWSVAIALGASVEAMAALYCSSAV